MRAWVPADLDRPDRIAFGLTARQLALLGPYAVVTGGALLLLLDRLPLPASLVVAAALAGIGWGIATATLDGEPLDLALLAGLRFAASPKRRVLAPEGAGALPRWHRAAEERLSLLEPPWRGADVEGFLDLDELGLILLLRASSRDLSLCSGEEVEAVIDAYSAFLNALSEPVTILVHSEPVHLEALAREIEATAHLLPHPHLQEAAASRCRYLRKLSESGRLVRREVYLCVRGPDRPRLWQRADELMELLRPLGVRASRLSPTEAESLLRSTWEAAPCEGRE